VQLSRAYRPSLYPFLVAALFFGLNARVLAQDGAAIFKTNCARCHAMEARLTGPALKGVFDRIRDGKGISDEETVGWMFKWIKNSRAVVDAGDEYAVKIFNDFNKTPMDPFLTLPDGDVHAVIDYIRNWQPAVAVVTDGPVQPKGAFPTKTILLILAVMLILIALILSRVTNVLGRIHAEKEGRKVPPERPFYLTRKFATLSILAVTTVGLWWVSGRAIDLQRQQGYEPTQPIAFSHAVHAGVQKIDCRYCHVGVERGKQATIPSVNVCMNCHKTVRTGTVTGSKEIAKIYAAAGFDTLTQMYDLSKTKPIEWMRVHNLPDHVYFNHQQHVVAGKIECQTCHGAVEEMDVLRQDAPLSMGWCLNCHRTQEVQFAENKYYTESYEGYIHEPGVTVEMIGGTECQKCHY